MRVVTADSGKFSEMCGELREAVRRDGYDYDTLVGIARGGVYVAETFGEDYYTVSCQRGGTRPKSDGIVKRVVRRLPRWVNSLLRCVESGFLQLKEKMMASKPRKVAVEGRLAERLKEGGHRLLVVDDAVDSGNSLQSVINSLQAISSDNEIRTAALTVTWRAPRVSPDYALFRNSTLIRFPWAPDLSN